MQASQTKAWFLILCMGLSTKCITNSLYYTNHFSLLFQHWCGSQPGERKNRLLLILGWLEASVLRTHISAVPLPWLAAVHTFRRIMGQALLANDTEVLPLSKPHHRTLCPFILPGDHCPLKQNFFIPTCWGTLRSLSLFRRSQSNKLERIPHTQVSLASLRCLMAIHWRTHWSCLSSLHIKSWQLHFFPELLLNCWCRPRSMIKESQASNPV